MNETAFGSYGSTFVSLVIATLYQNVPVGSCSLFEQEEKYSVVFELNWKRPVGT